MSDVAKRAVACKGWRWVAGMLTTDGWRLALLQSDGKWIAVNERTSSVSARVDVTGALPDLDDAATLGCLLHLVREAWGAPHGVVRQFSCGRWEFEPMRRPMESDPLETLCETEAAALVAALEAAP